MKIKKPGKWVFLRDEPITPEEEGAENRELVATMLTLHRDGRFPFSAIDQFQDYFPEGNKVADGGEWILVKHPPHTEYTVPPLSLWFAEPWPMEPATTRKARRTMPMPHRVKIVTPKGTLGLFPREYSVVKNPEKYYEFIGEGMEIKFFGGDLSGVPEPKLFYLQSRGVSKRDALAMLIGHIKAHGICWIETKRKIAEEFVRDWPDQTRLATQ